MQSEDLSPGGGGKRDIKRGSHMFLALLSDAILPKNDRSTLKNASLFRFFQDVCKTSIFYAEHMCRRVMSQTVPRAAAASSSDEGNSAADGGGPSDPDGPRAAAPSRAKRRKKKPAFVVTPALCLAINNIDYVLEFIRPFVTELGLDDVLDRLEALRGRVIGIRPR